MAHGLAEDFRKHDTPDGKVMSVLGNQFLRFTAFIERVVLSKIRIPGDREHEIVLNRIIFCIIFGGVLYSDVLSTPSGTLPFVDKLKDLHFYYSALGALILIHLVASRKVAVWRRVSGIIIDVVALTMGMLFGGEYTTVAYILFLWVILGNGFRFGNNYLYFAVSLTLVGFTYAVTKNSFWNQHFYLDLGLFVGLIVLPAYASSLIKKMSDALNKAELANVAKGMFIASVSHELRTPLTSIIGLGELLQGTPLTSEQDGMVRTIGTSGRSLLRLINSILNIAKAEANLQEVTIEKIDLYQLLSDIRAMLAVQAQSKETQLVFEIGASTPKFILGNLRHLEEILINLVGNAVKFTVRGSVRVLIDSKPAANGKLCLRCNIYDTGIGIAPDKQAKIFERFTQADETIIDQFGGSGLGLAITKQLVELYDGKLGVNSAIGQGSHFWFEIDVTSVRDDQDISLDLPQPSTQMLFPDGLIEKAPSRPLSILVAEDNITNQKIISKILTLAGHTVTAVDDGEKALDTLLTEEFDIALMDINMPMMNGLEATRLYHFSNEGHEHTPIIALTADASEQTRRRCLDAGIRAFCTKPIETDRLIAIISQVANTYSSKKSRANPKAAQQNSIKVRESNAFDLDVLANLTRLGGAEFCDEILSEFLNESEALANSIKEAALSSDIHAFHSNCHSLQSCAGSVGAMGLVALMINWQLLDATGLKKSGVQVAKSLNSELNSVRAALFNRIEPEISHVPQTIPFRARA